MLGSRHHKLVEEIVYSMIHLVYIKPKLVDVCKATKH